MIKHIQKRLDEGTGRVGESEFRDFCVRNVNEAENGQRI